MRAASSSKRLVRPGAEARRRADLSFRGRRRDDGARAGDVAREEQRENARLYSDLEDDCGEAHNVVGQHLLKDHEPDDEPDAHCDQRSSSEVELVVARRQAAWVAGGRPSFRPVPGQRRPRRFVVQRSSCCLRGLPLLLLFSPVAASFCCSRPSETSAVVTSLTSLIS